LILLADRLVIAWLQACVLDIIIAGTKWGTASVAHLKFLTQLLSRAEGRLAVTVKTLLQVRESLRPTLSPLQISSRLNGSGRGKAAGPGRRTPLLAAAEKN
jgi:hypothetical protein